MSNAVYLLKEHFIKALEAEIFELKEGSGKKFSYLDIYFIEVIDQFEKIYKFGKDKDRFIDDNAPLFLLYGDKKIRVKLIEQRGDEFVVASHERIGNFDSITTLEIDKWSIYEKLIDIYKEPINDKIAFSLFTKNISNISCQRKNYDILFNESQLEALHKSFEHNVSVIWGPPGTGKSYTLLNIANEHYKQGEKIVLVAHSNMAVDRLLKQFIDLFGDEIKRSQFIRLGKSQYEDYTLDNYIEKKHSDLFEKRKRYFKEIYEKGYSKELIKKIDTVNGQIDKKKHIFMGRVPIIFTTLTRLFYDSFFPHDKFTVLIDEISMAPMPFIYYALTIVDKHAILAGDFNQLPSIAISNDEYSKKYLQNSIFDYLELDSSDNSLNLEWFTMLNVQYRMNPEISNLANTHFYGNRLGNSALVDGNIIVDQKHGDSSIIAYNIANSFALTVKGTQKHFNLYNVLLIKNLYDYIKKSYANMSVGIITLYNSEVELLKTVIKDKRISISTVHKFQGQERDIIIFDFVESFGMHWSMLSLENSFKLINVAITRAKYKLFVVGDFYFLRDKIDHDLIQHFADIGIEPYDFLERYVIDKSIDLSIGELGGFTQENNFGLKVVSFFKSTSNVDVFSNNIEFVNYILYIKEFIEKEENKIDISVNIYTKKIKKDTVNISNKDRIDFVEHNSYYDCLVIDKKALFFGKLFNNEFFLVENSKLIFYFFEKLGLNYE